MKKRLLAVLVCLGILLPLLPATTFAADTFTITYMTNAGVEMGTVEYTVGDPNNDFPALGELSTMFPEFIAKAAQKGNVAVGADGSRWYTDEELTETAIFPTDAQSGEAYTVYLRFTVGLSVTEVSNGAENESYSEVESTFQPNMSVNWSTTVYRHDTYGAVAATFEKKVGEDWVEVDDSYYTDNYWNTTWTNMIWFSDVSDSGTYRLKYLRYTATDREGNVLYYDNAYDTAGNTYEVNITPVELTIAGVTAIDRDQDGTNKVELEGGTLEGVLFGDDVSFVLGQGTVADTAAGENKQVTTNIQLTGADAGNYTLVQPTDITVNIAKVAAPPVVPDWPTGETSTIDSGWRQDRNDDWYFYAGTRRSKGWLEDQGYHYYLDPETGKMQTGWQYLDEEWYYFYPAWGGMAEGWAKVDGYWYYLDPETGKMQTGWQHLDGEWYYFYPAWGGMAEGWVRVGEDWYYTDPEFGEMQTGWELVNGKWYCLYSWGGMAYNAIVDGYILGADGAWIQ